MLRAMLRRPLLVLVVAMLTVFSTGCLSVVLGLVVNEDGSGTFQAQVLLPREALVGAEEGEDPLEQLIAGAPPGYTARRISTASEAGVEYVRGWSTPEEFPAVLGDFSSQFDLGDETGPLFIVTQPELVKTEGGWRIGMIFNVGAMRDIKQQLLNVSARDIAEFVAGVGGAVGGAIALPLEAFSACAAPVDSLAPATPAATPVRVEVTQENREMAELLHEAARGMRFDVLISMPGDATGTHNADEVVGSTLVWHVPLSGAASRTVGAESTGAGGPAALPPPGTALGTIDEGGADGDAPPGGSDGDPAERSDAGGDGDDDGVVPAATVSDAEAGGVGGILLGGAAQPPEPGRAATGAAVAAVAVAIATLLPALLAGASGAAAPAAGALGAGAAGGAPVGGGGDEFEDLGEGEPPATGGRTYQPVDSLHVQQKPAGRRRRSSRARTPQTPA